MDKGRHGAPRRTRATEPKAEIAKRTAELLADLETVDVAAVLMVALSLGQIAAIETAVKVGVRAQKEPARDVRAAPMEDDPRLVRALAAIEKTGKDRHHTWSLWKDNRSVCLREGCGLEVHRLSRESPVVRARCQYVYVRAGVELARGAYGFKVPPCLRTDDQPPTREDLTRQLAELNARRSGLAQQLAELEQRILADRPLAPEGSDT